jgi:ribonuclease D
MKSDQKTGSLHRDNEAGRPGFDRRMTKAEINTCPIRKWTGPIAVISSRNEVNRAVEQLGRESVLGFDTETRPAFKKGQKYLPALLQLATAEQVYLFQLNRIGMPDSLVSILADPAIVKAGVSLSYDLRELKKLTMFNEAGFVGLGRMSRDRGVINNGLRGLAAVVLGLRISKTAQTSNWAKEELTRSQIVYAATDAWVGRELYLKLLEI